MSEKILRVGVYGTGRGTSHIKNISFLDNAKVVAICEQNPKAVEKAMKFCPPDVVICPDYDALLDAGLDVVILANFLPDHAKCAIQAMRKGINVVSECLAAVTMKECVDLVEAVEETGMYYSMAENSPYDTSNLEIGRLYQSGKLGELSYGEAEYCHPFSPEKLLEVCPDENHWRYRLPKTYYLTHPLGSLMNISRLMPKKVQTMITTDHLYARQRNLPFADSGAQVMVQMENGVVFRVTGWANYGAHASHLRIACTGANVEKERHDHSLISLTFNEWDLPKEMAQVGTHISYKPPVEPEVAALIPKGLSTGGHSVADFRCVKNYIDEIAEGRAPDMDVYRSVAQCAVAILGWRSALEHKEYDIPDFKDPAARDQYRNDDLSPWRDEIPYYIYPTEKPE